MTASFANQRLTRQNLLSAVLSRLPQFREGVGCGGKPHLQRVQLPGVSNLLMRPRCGFSAKSITKIWITSCVVDSVTLSVRLYDCGAGLEPDHNNTEAGASNESSFKPCVKIRI
jgi:hypothetical protein